MICYLVRHGKDDDTVRGGWSDSPLTDIGIAQAKTLAETIFCNQTVYKINKIYSSDLPRAIQTAELISEKLNLQISMLSQFRETNNGVFAGMKNEIANKEYPNLFWNTLEWEQPYPGGESPKEFYERICCAWNEFSNMIQSNNENVILVTHGGVMNVITHLINNTEYSNKNKQERFAHATLLPLKYNNNAWIRL
jgi:probable phosphoglycerate mutase